MEFGVGEQRIKVLFDCIGLGQAHSLGPWQGVRYSQQCYWILAGVGCLLLYLPFPLLGPAECFLFLLLNLYFISVGWCISPLTRTVVQ